MKLFVDTGKIEDIKKANDLGVICGVTTNPSLITKEGGRSQEEILKEIYLEKVNEPDARSSTGNLVEHIRRYEQDLFFLEDYRTVIKYVCV